MDADLINELKKITLKKMDEHPVNADKTGEFHPVDYEIFKREEILLNKEMEITLHAERPLPMSSGKYHMHGHEFFELNYVISGSVHELVDDREVILNKGDILIMNPNAFHGLYMDDPNDILLNIDICPELFYSIYLSCANNQAQFGRFFLNYVLPDATNNLSYLLFKIGHQPFIDRVIERMILEKLRDHPYRDINNKHYLAILFSEMFQTTLEEPKPQDNRITEILNYLSNHMAEASLKSTAEAFYMHPNYLSAYVKKKTGRPFGELLIAIKFTKAKDLLTNTAMSIEEIAYLLGYAETMSFYNMFKKNAGVTPAQYRKSQIIPEIIG